MGCRRCCLTECPSFSSRNDDRGVTYHRFPMNPEIRRNWLSQCRIIPTTKITKTTFVCSRHFKKSDFQAFKGTKYLLKQGVIPSIFPWGNYIQNDLDLIQSEDYGDSELSIHDELKFTDDTNSPKGVEHNMETNTSKANMKTPTKRSASAEEIQIEPQKKIIRKTSDSAIIKNTFEKITPIFKSFSENHSPVKKVEPVLNFVPGTKIEAQDFNKVWHTAKVVEVDIDDREVLVHFEKNIKGKTPGIIDEWISMDSSRLRPIQPPKKTVTTYNVGEKCLARWSDARKFPGTVQKVMENDNYEILFDDGYKKIVKATYMNKWKKSMSETNPSSPSGSKLAPLIKEESPVIRPHTQIDKPVINWESIPSPPEGEWSCHWYNDAPVGQDSSVFYSEGRVIKTVVVKDNRLPNGWVKHVYQRTGLLGKWDIILVNPAGKVFRSKLEMKQYCDDSVETCPAIYDFSLHKRRAKELGLCTYSPEYFAASRIRFTPNLKSDKNDSITSPNTSGDISTLIENPEVLNKDFVMIGSVKVKIINNLFRCPDESCNKNFRKENHLQIHIKHYHKEIAESLGVCPNMTDLAYLRTIGTTTAEDQLPKNHLPNNQFFEKVHQQEMQQKTNRKSFSSISGGVMSSPHSKLEVITGDHEVRIKIEDDDFKTHTIKKEEHSSTASETETTPTRKYTLLEEALNSQPSSDKNYYIKQGITSSQLPSSLLSTPNQTGNNPKHTLTSTPDIKPHKTDPQILIKPHTVPKSTPHRSHFGQYRRKIARSRTNLAKPRTKTTNLQKKALNQTVNESFTEYDDTRYSFGSSESTFKRQKFLNQIISNESGQDTNSQNASSIAEPSQSPKYINEDGEMIKIVRMKQEEIINCICTFPEEDGLMIQCELCLCWQHGICNGIERENKVPEKYICYICRNPTRGRSSLKYKHDQEWLFEGRLPTLNPDESIKRENRYDLLKKSHTLTGNLLELKEFLHSLKVKINIAEKKDHPKMYLWSNKWESSPPIRSELSGIERLNTSNKITKAEVIKIEGLEIKTGESPVLETIIQNQSTPPPQKNENVENIPKTPDENMKSEIIESKTEDKNELYASLLHTPGGTNIDLLKESPLNVKENLCDEKTPPNIPMPEAPIDPTECQFRLLEHIQKQQNIAMSRLTSIEEEVMALESMDETSEKLDNENFTRTKQTIQMLIRDLTTMRKIAAVNSSEVYGTFI